MVGKLTYCAKYTFHKDTDILETTVKFLLNLSTMIVLSNYVYVINAMIKVMNLLTEQNAVYLSKTPISLEPVKSHITTVKFLSIMFSIIDLILQHCSTT